MVIDDWELFSESPLPVKGEFYNNLNMRDITYSDYNHAKRICKNLLVSGEKILMAAELKECVR